MKGTARQNKAMTAFRQPAITAIARLDEPFTILQAYEATRHEVRAEVFGPSYSIVERIIRELHDAGDLVRVPYPNDRVKPYLYRWATNA